MTDVTSSKRPRRKQAVPLKYEFSDDSDNTDKNTDKSLSFERPPKRTISPSKPENAENKATPAEGRKRILLKFKIRDNGSSCTYVELAPQEDNETEIERPKRHSDASQASAVAQKVPKRTLTPPTSMKRYQTFPKSFRAEAARHAEAHGMESAAKHFAVSLSKIKLWMKSRTAQTIPAKTEHTVPQRLSDSLRLKAEQSKDTYAPAFKLFTIRLAQEKGTKEASSLLSLDEASVSDWLSMKEEITRKAIDDGCPQWETDVFVGIRRDLMSGHDVRVEDLLERACTLKMDETTVGMEWMWRWCAKFNVLLKDPTSQGGMLQKEVSKVTQLQLPIEMTSMVPEHDIQLPAIPTHEKTVSKKHNVPRVSRGSTKIDCDLWKWCKALEKKGKKLTKAIVCARAQHLFGKHGYSAFRAGDGWYRAWKSRCEILNAREACEPQTEPSKGDENVPSTSSGNSHPLSNDDEAEMSLQAAHTSGSPLCSGKEESNNPMSTASNSPSCPSQTSETSAGQMSYTSAEQPYVEPLVLLNDCDTSSGPDSVKCQLGSSHPLYTQDHDPLPVHSSLSFSSYWGGASLNASHQLKDAPQQHCHPIASFHDSFLSHGFSCSAMDPTHSGGVTSVLQYDDHTAIGDHYHPSAGAQKKKNERYVPEFKLQVVKHALQTTFKKTAERFGVHHSTVAEWCRDKEKLERMFPEERGTLAKGSNEHPASPPPEVAFLEWLQDCNMKGHKIEPSHVKEKVKGIIDHFGEDKVESTCRWLYIWHKKRLELQQMIEDNLSDLSESNGKEARIAFPPAVKLEIVRVAERQKLTDTAKCFQIDRNSLSDWSKAQMKLKAMAKEGKVRRKEVSKSAKALQAEKEVFEWYQQCRNSGYKPGPQEVRAVAAETYRKYGDTTMKCSIGWYSRWSRRFGIQLRYEKDEEILEWVLTQLEQNRTITHHDIQLRAIAALSQTRSGFKCSAGWPIRFCKRHQALLQQQPKLDTPLPSILEDKVNAFRHHIQQLQEQHSLTNAAIGAMDEVPLYFSSPASGGGTLLIRRCGLETAHAIVLLACLADGAILPPLVILKGTNYNQNTNYGFVLHQDEMKVEATTVDYWATHLWSRYVPSPSLLLLDCFEPHVSFAACTEDVKVAIAPGGCTSQVHPVIVWLRCNFQTLVQKSWLESGSPRNVPSPQEALDCITRAWQHLQCSTAQDAIRKSFTVTGAVLAADHSEDHLIGKAGLLPGVDDVDSCF
ncbi:uncharacterized protein LOC135385883 [Ornithodoros turicata]